MEGNLADIRCPHCGAPAEYDIVGGRYLCAYCGSRSGIGEVQAQRRGFRSLQQERIRKSAEKTRLMRANCTGCGASVVIEEGEAAVTCAFCGRALVREEYLASTEMPELPMVNLSNWAAEEAFSIYDHPPVWIFEKTEDFSEEALWEFLESFDLSKVVIQGPKDAEWD